MENAALIKNSITYSDLPHAIKGFAFKNKEVVNIVLNSNINYDTLDEEHIQRLINNIEK